MTAAEAWPVVGPLAVALARVGPAVLIGLGAAQVGLTRTVGAAVAVLVAGAMVGLGAPSLAGAADVLAGAPLSGQLAILARELAIGVVLGLTAAVPVVAAELAGAWLAAAAGEAPGDGPWARATGLLGALVFFALGGHRAVIAAIAASYRAAPVADATSLVDAGAALFGTALALAAPLLGAVVVAALVVGAVDRSSGLGAGAVPTVTLQRSAAVLALAAMAFAFAYGVAALTRGLPAGLLALSRG
ncbi:MAG: flagellar biosynthetic protein FliR [Kofleriaceae bacterium]